MFKRIDIRNFQCHEHVTLDLEPGVNMIVGDTDSGKSAVIRAIRWACFNRPSGEEFVRNHEGRAVVTIDADKYTIKRRRGKGHNEYTLNGEPLKAFGDKVPDTVTEALNLGPINFQRQHDAPFWFGESPGEVSRQLNEIVNLGVMDKALASLNADIRANSEEVRIVTARLDAARSYRQSLAGIEDVDNDLRALEKLAQQTQHINTKASRLRRLVEDGSKVHLEVKRLTTALQTLNSTIPQLQKLADSVAKVRERRKYLQELISRIENQQEVEQCLVQKKTEAEKELRKLVGRICPLCHQPVKSPTA